MDNNLVKRIFTSTVLILLLISMFFSSTMMISTIIIISFITFYEFNGLIFRIFKSKIIRFLVSSSMLLYLFIFTFIIFFVESVQYTIPKYKIYVFYSIIVCINTDVGGYVFGKIFKGKKLTKISPNKTISGSIGSFIFSLFAIPIFVNDLSIINFNLLVISTLIISLISQLGDLAVSYFKRLAKIKDTGNILPGHGGILDRVDGILFAVPIGFFLLDIISII
tara:strand:+ start:115 stop:780 length:666 start_codon:yes stop_codon:yes gene_type:complete